MAKKIGSLYYEITGDTKKLGDSLTESKQKMTGLKGAASELSTTLNSKLTSAIAPAALVSAGIYGIKNALDSTVAYAKQVEDLSRLIGATPEEASRLIQAADDMRISYDTLSTSMEAAIRKGFDPSIDGLEEIRKKYQELNEPIEKSKLLMDTFGRAGADMAPLMELPANKLKELAEAADKAGLTMSGSNLQAAKDYALAMDDLDDAINGAKYRLGNELIPEILKFIDKSQTVQNEIENQKLKWMDWIPVLAGIRNLILWINQQSPEASKASNYNPYKNLPDYTGGYGGFASGGSFTVPPGYPGDSFGMRVQSGEKVKVTQAGVPDDTARMLRNLPSLIGRAVRDGVIQGLAQ